MSGRPTARRRISTRGLVAIVVACLLRAMLPAELTPGFSGGRANSVAGDSGRSGHVCACGDAGACGRSCCCAPGGTADSERSVPIVRALACHGIGAGGPATQTTSWIAVLPGSLEWVADRASWSKESAVPERLRDRHPEPATPPPLDVERVI